jgi:HD-GYP domain-containing protein (c-di-GMP phosphodiesterase class II)
MVRALPTARTWVAGTIALGGLVLAVALVQRAEAPLETLALLAAAVVFTELFQVPSDETSAEPGDAHAFSFSSGVHIAAVLLIGPWTAALVAAFGVLAVDRLRGAAWRHVAYNAAVFALAAAAAGHAFLVVGGTPGSIPTLPGDFLPLAALSVTYYSVNYLFMSAVVALHTAQRFWPLAREATIDGISPAAAETGLGFGFAFFVFHEPWALVALVPLLLGVYSAVERLARLRRETAQALETFANVIDERDVSTFRHSARVADDVHGLARALGAPSWAAGRLRWAGRLHDLGKIAIDAAVLRKPGKLDDDEWAALRRHPRLSARLLRRFHYAGSAARAVELHHERFDGRGYYGIDAADIPMASHLIVVADSYDAMTSDRSYRRGLTPEQALAEIEANAGTQFHPAVARAFVAYKRGLDPLERLTPDERAEIVHGLSARPRAGLPRLDLRSPVLTAGGVAAAFLALGVGRPHLAVPGIALAALSLSLRRLDATRVERITNRLFAALEPGSPAGSFERLHRILAGHVRLQWAAVLAWNDRELDGMILCAWSRGLEEPNRLAVTSWILREADANTRVLTAAPGELGPSAHVALPLGLDHHVAGYLVLAVSGRPEIAARALGGCRTLLTRALLPDELRSGVEPESPARRLRAVGTAR